MISWVAGIVLTGLISSAALNSQAADARLEFDVDSVKVAPPYVPGTDYRTRGGPGTDNPGQVTYPRTFLLSLLREAYGVRSDQISGPDWLGSEAYSIIAKIPPNTTKDQFKVMLQNLLAERFHLTLHYETKALSVYRLLVAEGGPKMKQSADGDAGTAPQAAASSEAEDERGFPVLSPGRTRVLLFRDGMVCSKFRETMSEFAEGCGALVNLSNGDSVVRGGPPPPRVIDETGLNGKFDFTLEFAGAMTLPSNTAAALAAERGGQMTAEGTDSDPRGGGPNLFSAVQKQLGLKLEKGNKPVDILVIDHVDKVPTEN